MAWYNIVYFCGHEGRKQLYGKIKERESYVEWAEHNKLCPECEAKEREQRIKKENEEAAKKAENAGLPALTGTDKQVSWATTIRQTVVDKRNDYLMCYMRGFRYYTRYIKIDSLDPELIKQEFEDAFNLLIAQKTESKFWIDNRYDFDGFSCEKVIDMVVGLMKPLFELHMALPELTGEYHDAASVKRKKNLLELIYKISIKFRPILYDESIRQQVKDSLVKLITEETETNFWLNNQIKPTDIGLSIG